MRSRFAVASLICAKPCLAQTDWTGVTNDLNDMISSGGNGVYSGGSGIMVRAQDFEDTGDSQVVASTFWSNDIYAPSQFYPTAGVPWFPNDNWDGFGTTDWMKPGLAGAAGPWSYAALGVVVGSGMSGLYPKFEDIQKDDWGWGVFYASDSNAADKRCAWWDDNQGYDCPGGWVQNGIFSPSADFRGAGNYPMGNPASGPPGESGGGAGCHFDTNVNAMDQEDSYDAENLVGSYQCECNYNFKQDWSAWVWNFINSGKQKDGFEDRTWLHGGNKAPQWAIDTAICWVNNPRDLIQIQNQLFWLRSSWNNALIPTADWTSSDPSELRKYWGWNEVPASRDFIDNPSNWDTIMIKLPAAVCNNADGDWGKTDKPQCLGDAEALQLEVDLDEYVTKGKLLVGADYAGERPGSYIVFAREYGEPWDDAGHQEFNWQREFFCANWNSPNGKYQVVHLEPDTGNPAGACYLDYGVAPPAPPSPPSPQSVSHTKSGLCMDFEGSATNGASLVGNSCSGTINQQWAFTADGTLTPGSSSEMCVDVPGSDYSNGVQLALWECNGSPNQVSVYDSITATIQFNSGASCLDLIGDGSDGSTIAIWECDGGDYEIWDVHLPMNSAVV